MATTISSISAELNALMQAAIVTDNATEVLATIPAREQTITVAFDKSQTYTLQQVRTEVLLALTKANKTISSTTVEGTSTGGKSGVTNTEPAGKTPEVPKTPADTHEAKS